MIIVWALLGYLVIGAIAFFGIGLFIVCAEEDFSDEPMGGRAITWTAGTGAIIIALIAVNFIGWISTGGGTIPQPGTIVAAKSLGMTSGKSYPIEFGRTIDGSVGSGYVYGGLFSTEGHMHVTPTSSVSMKFRVGDSPYDLQIPMSKIKPVLTDGPNHATFYLKNGYLNEDGTDADYGTYTQHCEPVVKAIVLTAKCTNTFRVNDATVRRGLGPIVANNLDSVTLSLKSDMYDKLFGTP